MGVVVGIFVHNRTLSGLNRHKVIPKKIFCVFLRPLIFSDVWWVCAVAVLAGVAGKTMVPNMWSVLPGDASSSILSHQIAIIRSKHTYLLSLTAHLPLSRTRRLFIAVGYRRSGNGGIRGYAMGPVLHTVDWGHALISLQQTTGSTIP